MNKPLIFLLLTAFLVLFPACGSASDEDSGRMLNLRDEEGGAGSFPAAGGQMKPVGRGSFTGAPVLPGPVFQLDKPPALASTSLVPGAGEPVSLAAVALAVESVEVGVGQVEAIAAGLGGFTERLSISGGAGTHRADVVVKVPQGQFTPAMERLEALGQVQFRSLGSEDFADQRLGLTARLASYRKEEQSLNSLLERSSSVPELLSVERELARVRANIEQHQEQLNLLEQQANLATIHVALFPLGNAGAGAPAAGFALEVSDVTGSVTRLREFVASRGGAIDRVYLASSEDLEQAEIAFRVFVEDFNQTVQFIEGQGQVESRELLEQRSASGSYPDGSGAPTRRPGARFQVSYLDRPSAVSFWVPVAVVAGLLALAAVVTYMLRIAYSRGRQRGSFM